MRNGIETTLRQPKQEFGPPHLTRFNRPDNNIFNRKKPGEEGYEEPTAKDYMHRTLADLTQMRKDSYKESVNAYTKAAEQRK